MNFSCTSNFTDSLTPPRIRANAGGGGGGVNVDGGHGRGIGSGGGGSDSGNFLRSSLNQILHPDADVISLDVESLDQIDLAQIVNTWIGFGPQQSH